MKKIWFTAVLLAALLVPVHGAEIPKELEQAAPPEARALLRNTELDGTAGISEGLGLLAEYVSGQAETVLHERTAGAAAVLLVVLLCGTAEGFARSSGGKDPVFLPVAGALSVTAAASGSLDRLIGLGAETIDQLTAFSDVLLPTMAAAAAVSGGAASATVHQAAAVFCTDLLMHLIDQLLLPLVYLYIGALTAQACLPKSGLGRGAELLKKAVTWALSGTLLLFTLYLSMARVIAGSVDASAVRLTKAAISGAVPVVGGIIAEASETVLAGASLLKSTVGVFGMLSVLAACAYPFLQLAVQYLLFKLTAFLAGLVGAPYLCTLIDGLGSAFGLVLGMTGSCGLLLLVSVLSSVAIAVP